MTIKEFSKLCNCTTQTLRYYDKIDLLKPAKVDQFTGYRYYDSEQAFQYVKIKNLQEGMFSIEEIRELLEKDEEEIVKAFDVKIAEQKAKLEKIIQIQKSYQNDYMKVQKLVREVQDKINNDMGSYDICAEYGISQDYHKKIMEEMNEQFDQALEQIKEMESFLPDEDMHLNHNFEVTYSDIESPVADVHNRVVMEMNGWDHTVEILEKMPKLDGEQEYILYFEVVDEKMNYYDFCQIVISIVKDRNETDGINLSCIRNGSKDGQNHFWLLKK